MKERLDNWLLAQGLFETRSKAQAAILAGLVLVDETTVNKSGFTVKPGMAVRVKESLPWVSRGALKLLHALDAFRVSPAGLVCLDVGSSTGGFTEVLLARGAQMVYAVDSGTNQLDWKLRSDSRVRTMENTNARTLEPARFDPRPVLAVMDVSFISVTKILPALIQVLQSPFTIITLIKPQFELSQGLIGKNGLVAPENRPLAVKSVLDCAQHMGLIASDVISSPILGQKSGNEEFLVCLTGHQM